MTPGPWEACSNGAGKRRWYVSRLRDANGHAGGIREWIYDSRSRLVTFASREAALRRCQKLNAKGRTS